MVNFETYLELHGGIKCTCNSRDGHEDNCAWIKALRDWLDDAEELSGPNHNTVMFEKGGAK